jgi:16S rRNA C967 or C1407 C5-methylase (RsmB/RsmF family)/NOL1/NOP2/fmu family ribosome biogenesis protein
MKIPAPITRRLQAEFGIDAAAFEAAHDAEPPTSVRLNPLKPACPFLTGHEQAVLWSDNSYYLNVRPLFTADPLFHAGCYYVQEASSMFLAEAVKQTADISKKIIALDACAAPGGKSTLLASTLNDESLLVSNEVISTRVPVLVHNMSKWGSINNVVTNNDPRDFSRLPEFFDLVVVDAPCSGSGLFRKQEDAVEHWSEENVKHCSLRQLRILHDLLPALKENGVLIYSTCSYSVEEDENICEELLNEHRLGPLRLSLANDWGIVETKTKSGAYGYRFFPHLAKGEGFFISCFRKVDAGKRGEEARSKSRRQDTFARPTRDEEAYLRSFTSSEKLQFAQQGGELIAYGANVTEQVAKAAAALKIKKYPLHAGQFKGKDFIPHAGSAYIPQLGAKVQRVELSNEDAMKYLRKQDLQLTEAPKGVILLTHKGFGLGWAKNLGNRINNYYPAEWRILRESF